MTEAESVTFCPPPTAVEAVGRQMRLSVSMAAFHPALRVFRMVGLGWPLPLFLITFWNPDEVSIPWASACPSRCWT